MTGFNTTFNITNKNILFISTVSIIDDGFSQLTTAPGAYEIESLNNEVKRIIIEEGYFTELVYPFTIQPNFRILGPLIEISSNITGSQIAFTPDESIRDLLGYKPVVIHEGYNLSDLPVEILSSDTNFLDCDTAHGMFFKGKRSGKMHNFTMDIDLGYKYNKKFRGGVQWYMFETTDFISITNF